MANGDAVSLPDGGDLRFAVDVAFDLKQDRRLGVWSTVIAGYMYSLEDPARRTILAYHWHAGGRSRVQFPHLHLGSAAEVGRDGLAQAHLPTGPVSLTDVLRLLIVELGVQPMRRDWERVLAVPIGT